MRICCRFRFLAQAAHTLCPNFFLLGQVTRWATFGEKNFSRKGVVESGVDEVEEDDYIIEVDEEEEDDIIIEEF